MNLFICFYFILRYVWEVDVCGIRNFCYVPEYMMFSCVLYLILLWIQLLVVTGKSVWLGDLGSLDVLTVGMHFSI